MSDDILDWLRPHFDWRDQDDPSGFRDAYDEIERLREENKRLSMKADILHNVAITPYGSAADEIERWQAIAFCRTCEPTDGYYCTRHRQDEEGKQ